jgi:DNA invertase Pin-like site-specific DNA recombinase
MLAVTYVRVSTDEQAIKGLSIPAQIEACEKYAKEHGLTIARTFVDEGETAKTDERDGFQEMVGYCKTNRDVRAVIVYDTSRFARNRYDAALYKRDMEKSEIRVHYASQHIEDTPEGKFLEGILEVFDEHYSLRLAVVVKRGMAESAKRGNWVGGPPYGYRVTRTPEGKRKLEIEPKEAEAVRLVYELFDKGFGCKTIAQKLNEMGYRTRFGKALQANMVKLILKNLAYLGMVVFGRYKGGQHVKRAMLPKENWIIVPGTHEALVSKEQFERVQAEMERRARNRKPGQFRSARRFAGMVTCSHCGRSSTALTGTSKTGVVHFYYGCRTHKTQSTKLCAGLRVRADLFEESIIRAIDEDVFSETNIKTFVEYAKRLAREMDEGRSHEKISIQRKLEAIEGKLMKVIHLVEDDVIDANQAKQRTQQLQAEKAELMERYARVEDALSLKSMIPTQAMLEAARAELRKVVAKAEPRVQREFFRRLIKSINTDGKTAEVTYNLGEFASGVGVRKCINVSAHEES